MAQVIVVGGGLSGLSSAHTVLERGGRVLVLDKVALLGGNSTKATSGINGAGTRTQVAKGVPDTAEIVRLLLLLPPLSSSSLLLTVSFPLLPTLILEADSLSL